ncbi:hypothetical protein FRC09_005959 [Ceratobasidium sp. 395]|nr:hypothetical protein FRC09_005959 [Ceratobasidium sp. 395]
MDSTQSCNLDHHNISEDPAEFLPHQYEGRMEGPYNRAGGWADLYWLKLSEAEPPRKTSVKCFRRRRSLDAEQLRKKIDNELEIWKILNNNSNPNVVPFLGVMASYQHGEDNQFVHQYVLPWPVCEYYKNGGMDDFLRKGKPDRFKRLQLLSCVIRGLAYMHTMVIIHGDLKTSNVLVNDLGDVAMICDFGSSRIECICYDGPEDQWGTLQWEAPEIHEGNPSTTSSDIWAFGCLALEAQFASVPYDPNPIVASRMIMKKELPARSESLDLKHPISSAVWGVMQRCWKPDAATRPSAQTLSEEFEAILTSTSL